ncbi:tail fiber domain-containing protein [Bacterioplanoides sp.]|uniref:tail fiber domain-containing protein n=1 Tax=Bacterioplanoides sp. TaxID=2066072 RepID=UPI003B596291
MCASAPEISTEAQDKQAAMVNWMGEDFEQRFQPLEQSLLDEVTNKNANIRQSVDEAGIAANKSYEATLGMSERNMARYGTELSEDQQAAMDASSALSAQGTQIGAQGMARDATTARYDQLQQGLMTLGSGIKSGAISGMTSAANLEANRNSQNQQLYAQSQSDMMSAIGTVAALAAAPYTGGASLAAIPAAASDKNAKKNIRKASTKKNLKDIESFDVKHFDYKSGMSEGRPEQGHIGGMVQDMPESMITADKKHVDLPDSIMTLVGATQELSKKVKKLEKRHVRS